MIYNFANNIIYKALTLSNDIFHKFLKTKINDILQSIINKLRYKNF